MHGNKITNLIIFTQLFLFVCLIIVLLILLIPKRNQNQSLNLPKNSIVYPFLKNTFGWGDQLVGFSTSILIAKKFNKDVYILFTDKHHMESMKSIFDLPDTKTLFIPHDIYKKNKSRYEINFIDHLIKNPTNLENMYNFFFQSTILSQKEPIILYVNQPAASLLYDIKEKETYARDLKNAYREINTIYFPFKNSIKNEWDQKIPIKGTNTIGIQIRTGDKSIKSINFTNHSLLDKSEYNNFSKDISKKIEKVNPNPTMKKQIYLATDDIEFLKTFKNENKTENILSLGLLENTHSMNATGEGFNKIFQEYYYLTRCPIIITSQNSNFGITAAYYSNNKYVIFYEDKGKVLKLYDLDKNAINKEFTFVHDLDECFIIE
jgi:hypothetical protein